MDSLDLNWNMFKIKSIALLTALLYISSFDIKAQEITRLDASFQDYMELLNAKGYEAYPFDISCLKDSTYTLTFEMKEYVGGQDSEISSKEYISIKNRIMVTDFMRRKLSTDELENIKRGSYDYENGIYSCSEKITIGFTPSDVDTVRYARVSVEHMGAFSVDMKLKPIENPLYEKPLYKYVTRPFKPSKFEEGEFIPLVLYCSFWFDAKHKVVRCCGEKEIDPLMTSEILKYSPHYYVIGVRITK